MTKLTLSSVSQGPTTVSQIKKKTEEQEAGRGNEPFTTLLAAARRARFVSWQLRVRQQPLQVLNHVALTKEAANAHARWDLGPFGCS